VKPYSLTTLKPGNLLQILEGYPLFSAFNLSLLACQAAMPPGEKMTISLCGLVDENIRCRMSCQAALNAAVAKAMNGGEPVVFHCPTGFLHFAIPCRVRNVPPLCLLGGGGCEPAMVTADIESSFEATGTGAEPLMKRVKKMPRITAQEMEKVAEDGHRLLPDLLANNLYQLAQGKIGRQIEMLADLSREIDQVRTAEEAAELLGDALVIIFDLPKIAVILKNYRNNAFYLQKALGLPASGLALAGSHVEEFLLRHPEVKAVSLHDHEALFPDSGEKPPLCIPLSSGDRPFGLLALFDIDPHPQDLQLMELLAGRAALKLSCLQREKRLRQENASSERLLTLISALSLKRSRDELFAALVEMSADLLSADRGSLMLLDESGNNLRIVANKGMTSALARNMRIPLGSGIAGRVAKNGLPLLVNDIEKDGRVGIPNRPRFQTKSFISIPLMAKGRPIGVLNLSDKEDQGIFTETDLALLGSFVTHAALIIERTESMERAERFEELSVTDPLTKLYNRRFLETRLEEELNRSGRQKLSFTVMMVDLDHFKRYNDCGGHLAGDEALKKSAQLLRHSAREMDIVTRFGGEEFCLILPGTTKKESLFVAERIRRAIERESFPEEKALPGGRLTASLGIASYPEDGQTAATLINASDLALYRAKDEGRNRYAVFDPSLKNYQEKLG
jgi:diguanylate cyclase (GGDEF)-like protein